MKNSFLERFKYYDKFECSAALLDHISDMLDALFESNEVDVCPYCEKLFLRSENALQYEQPDGDYSCECRSPENVNSAMADMWLDEIKEQK